MFFVNHFGPLDLFRQPFTLSIAKHHLTATRFGIFLSFIIYFLLGFFFFKSDFFVKQKPKIVLETSSLSTPSIIKYENRLFAFSIRDLEGHIFSDPSYFFFKVQSVSQFQETKNGSLVTNTQISEKTFHICRENDTASYNDYLLLKDSFCLDEDHFVLAGSKGELNTTSFQVLVYMCQNSTKNGYTCKSPTEINNFFIQKNLNLLYVNTLFQANNYNNPILLKYNSPLYSIDAKLTRLITTKLQKTFIVTDEAIIFPSPKTQESLTIESETSDFGLSLSSTTPIVIVFFFSSNNILTLSRTYQSLPEAVAVLGGLFSVLMIAGHIVSKMDKAIYLTTLLMNMLYSFQEPSKKLEKKHAENGNKESENFSESLSLKKIKKRKSKTFDFRPKGAERISISLKESGFMSDESPPSKTDRDSPKQMEKTDNDRGGELMTPVLTESDEKNHKKKGQLELQQLPLKVLKEEEEMEEESASQNILMERGKSDPEIRVQKQDAMKPQPQITETKIPHQKTFFENFSHQLLRKFFRNNSIKDENELRTLKEFLNYKEKQHKINFNFFDFLKLTVKKMFKMKTTFVEKLFMRARKIFKKEIDIAKILKRIQDIEKLKYLLMSEEQIALFDVLEKPLIYLKDEPLIESSPFVLKSKRSSEKQKIKPEAYHYYLELEKKKIEDLPPIDQKLFMLVDKKFKTFKKYFSHEC